MWINLFKNWLTVRHSGCYRILKATNIALHFSCLNFRCGERNINILCYWEGACIQMCELAYVYVFMWKNWCHAIWRENNENSLWIKDSVCYVGNRISWGETKLLNQIVKTVHNNTGELQNVHVRGISGHKWCPLWNVNLG